MKRPLHLVPLFFLLAACHKDADVILRQEEIPDPPSVMVTTRLVSMADTTHDANIFGQVRLLQDWTDIGPTPYSISGPAFADQSYSTISWRTTSGYLFHTVPCLSPNDINYVHWKVPDLQEFHLHSDHAYQEEVDTDLLFIAPSGPLLTEDSMPYTGAYTVSFARLFTPEIPNPAIPSYTALRPDHAPEGMLYETCVYFHIEGMGGESLQFNSPARLVNKENSSSQPWTFRPEKGAWVSQAMAEPRDEIGVKGTGYYAWAHPVPMTHLSGHLEVNGVPVPHASMVFTYGSQTHTIYTTNTGVWCIQLPAASATSITIPLPCGGILSKDILTPDAPSSSLDLSFTMSTIIPARIEGTVRDCQANPLEESIILSEDLANGFLFSPEASIDIDILACPSTSISLQALRSHVKESGAVIPWEVNDTIRVGSLFACEETKNEYLFLHVAGDQKMYWDLASRKTPENRLLIENDNPADGLDFSVFITGMEEGDYMDNLLNILFEDTQLGMRGYSLYCPTATTGCGFTEFTITHFPDEPGPWIRGTFEGRFWIKTFQPLTAGYRTVRGEFQVNREF